MQRYEMTINFVLQIKMENLMTSWGSFLLLKKDTTPWIKASIYGFLGHTASYVHYLLPFSSCIDVASAPYVRTFTKMLLRIPTN
jgi:hypothetical protein